MDGTRAALRAAAQFLALDLLGDALHTATHYAQHKVPCLRAFHLKHHENVEVCMMDAFYNHPVDMIISTLSRIVLPILILVPLLRIPWIVVGIYLLYAALVAAARHARGPWAYAISLAWLLPGRNDPYYHRVHHRCPGRHYGEGYWIWDWCLGTL